MENSLGSPLKKLSTVNLNQLFIITLVLSVVLGGVAGFMLASSKTIKAATNAGTSASTITAKSAQADKSTFKDFAEGTLKKKPDPKNGGDYGEGTHILIRDNAVPVALTSSVVDLSKYEGKKVTVYGETQKAIQEGWLMDVGRVEEK